MHPLNVLLLVAGLVFFFAAERGRFRLFGWAYVAVFALLVSQRSKPYYIAPIYPLMFAAGSVAIARATEARRRWRPLLATAMVLAGAATAPFTLPVLPLPTYLRYAAIVGLKPGSGERHAVGMLPQHYADMFGWEEIVSAVARVYRELPPEDRAKAGVVALNYGDAGAIDLLGAKYGLPVKAMSPHNSYWLWGIDAERMDVLIVIGGDPQDHRESYSDVREAGRIECGYCMPYENHRAIYVLRNRLRPIDEIWRTSKTFI
jgi:hypothetical protein